MNMLEAAGAGIAIARGATKSSGTAAKGVRTGAVLSCDMAIPNFGMLPRLVQVHGTTAALRFQGLLVLNLGRSFIVLTGIVCISEVSSFTATDFLQFPMLAASVGTVSFTAVPMFLYAIFEQPMRNLSTASSETSLALDDARSANAAWRNLVGYL